MTHRLKFQTILFTLTTVILTTIVLYSPLPTVLSDTSSETEMGTLNFTGKRQLLLGTFDEKARASYAHIQLQEKDQPTTKREKRLKYNPTGWHNYRFTYGDQGKKAWLMNRGHLIAFNFSGLNDEGRNLVPLTAWLNTGNFTGTKDSNPDAMLYYEKRLDSWLAIHPNYWLDYKVIPIYTGDELIPRHIHLQYVGLDEQGQIIEIDLGGKESHDANLLSHVILDNISPNATIDYLTGQATNTPDTSFTSLSYNDLINQTPQTVESQFTNSTETPIEAHTAIDQESPNPQSQQVKDGDENTIVYVARHGKSKVYFLSIQSMPSNTNLNNVVEMTLAEAKSQGKKLAQSHN